MTTLREKRANEILKNSSATWILLTDPVSVRYFSGFVSSNCTLLYSETEKVLFTDFRYRELASSFCSVNGWKFIEITKSISSEIAEVVQKNQTVLFQSDFLTVDTFNSLNRNLKEVTLSPAGELISSIFGVKSEVEISSLKQAAAIADRSYSIFLNEIKEGMSENDAADLLDTICKEEGSEKPSFSTIMLFGENSSLPHGVPSKNRLLKMGDFILTDCGCTIDDFGSDMTRVAVMDSASTKQKQLFDTVLSAQKIGKKAIKAGAVSKEIDALVRDFLSDQGYKEEFGHGTGHGVGLRIHERPALNSKNSNKLEAGMVVTVEPGVYLPNFGGVRVEDLLLVTEDGYEELSSSPRELIEIKN